MGVEKCRWYNDAEAAAVLMIDDLSNGFMDTNGRGMHPANDWGQMGMAPGSIFAYFRNQLLERYPELRYTVFVPFGPHSIGLVETAYPHKCADALENEEFRSLLRHIVETGNEVAYHGHRHGSAQPTLDPVTWSTENEAYTDEQYLELVRSDVDRAHRELGILIQGGKFPAYRYRASLKELPARLGMKWWSFDYAEARSPVEYHAGVLGFPANVSGDCFKARRNPLKGWLRGLWTEATLQNFIRAGHIIAIQEHFLASRPDGRRQTPNVYDDLPSLDRLYAVLRSADLWHATCSEIARYQDSFDHTAIQRGSDGSFEVRYTGHWSGADLTVAATSRRLLEVGSQQVLEGVYKKGRWIFNHLPAGVYRQA